MTYVNVDPVPNPTLMVSETEYRITVELGIRQFVNTRNPQALELARQEVANMIGKIVYGEIRSTLDEVSYHLYELKSRCNDYEMIQAIDEISRIHTDAMKLMKANS